MGISQNRIHIIHTYLPEQITNIEMEYNFFRRVEIHIIIY